MGRATANFFFGPAPWGPGEGSKGQIFNFNYKVNFKVFIPNFVFVLTNERYKTYQTGFNSVAWVMPQGWDLGALGVPRGSKKDFSNMVMWHIKSTRMTSRTECKYNFHPRVKLVTLG